MRYEDEMVLVKWSRLYFVIVGLVLSFMFVMFGGLLLLGLLNLL